MYAGFWMTICFVGPKPFSACFGWCMDTKYLIDIIKNESFYKSAIDAVRKDAKCVQIDGISSSVKSLFASAYFNEIHIPDLIITYNFER